MHEISNQDCHDLNEKLLCSRTTPYDKPVDAKICPIVDGDYALPKGFAEGSATVIATAGLPQCLLLFNEDHWRAITAELLNKTTAGVYLHVQGAEALRHLFLGNAAELDIGPRRTIELPSHLLEYAGINQILAQSWHGHAIELLPVGDVKFA